MPCMTQYASDKTHARWNERLRDRRACVDLKSLSVVTISLRLSATTLAGNSRYWVSASCMLRRVCPNWSWWATMFLLLVGGYSASWSWVWDLLHHHQVHHRFRQIGALKRCNSISTSQTVEKKPAKIIVHLIARILLM